ncbi:uncharacterized protein pdzph1 isoform X2 [Myripristis murdjan]|nr:uncharacterized protein LOC115368778 isoform X2 [Myripristis murdjan]
MRVVTSVSIDDIKDSPPRIIFQQSQEPLTEDPTSSATSVTNVMKINCSGAYVKLEIQEVLQIDTSGIKTTLVLLNQKGDNAETCFKSKCERTWAPNSNPSKQSSQNLNVINQSVTQDTINYNFSFGSTSEQKDAEKNSKCVIPSRFCHSSNYCQSCCNNNTGITLASQSSCPTPLSNFWPQGKRPSFCRSLSSDQFRDIPPPREFADISYSTLEDLTHDLASCRIGACGSTENQKGNFNPTQTTMYHQEPGGQCSLDDDESEDLPHCFDQLSESDNFEPMFMRPSSFSRSGFTKDFIDNHEKTWIRNNSIATVEHKACSLPKKRRQTFPGMTEGSSSMQEDVLPFRESFSSGTISSLIMQSLPLQAERLGRFYQRDDGLSPFGTECYDSSETRGSCKHSPEVPKSQIGKQPPINPFYPTKFEENTEDMFMIKEHFQEQSKNTCQPLEALGQHEMDLKESVYNDMENRNDYDGGDQMEPCSRVESGFDEEIAEVGYQNPGLVADEFSQRALVIQVIPPSPCGSEEHILETNSAKQIEKQVMLDTRAKETKQSNSLSVQTKPRKSSVMTITVGTSEQRYLQVDSKLSDGGSTEKHQRVNFNSASEEPCMSLVADMNEVDTLRNTEVNQPPEEAQPTSRRPSAAKTSIFSPPLSQIVEERKDPQLENTRRGTEDLEISANTQLCLPNGSTDQETESHKKEYLCKTDKVEKQNVSKSSSEMKDHLKLIHIDQDSSGSDHWAKRRKLFKDSKQWSSAGGSSITSDITEESVSEDTRSMDMTMKDIEARGFYTETFHSAAWIYRGDDVSSDASPPSLSTRPRIVSIRERTVKISKGMGEYPWGFRIQFSKPIVVTEVDTNGAAEEAGLMVGDYVLAVNGTDVTSVPHSEAADLARQGPDVLTLTIGSDIARAPNTPRPACRGYLHKRTQSGLIKGWRKRWFVLTHDCCLYYYRHKRDEGRRPALSAVKLEGAEVGPDVSLGKPFVFKCCPLSGNRVYFFCATSNQEMKRWLEAMEKAVHPITQNHVWVDVTRHNSCLPPLAVKSPECLGLLHQIDKNKDSWVQHYCILKDGCLYFYSGIRSTHALGGIYLHGYMVREQSFGSKKSAIELKPPSEEFKTFYLCAENATENKRWIVAIKTSINKWLPLHQAIQDYMSRPPEETRM